MSKFATRKGRKRVDLISRRGKTRRMLLERLERRVLLDAHGLAYNQFAPADVAEG